MQNGHEEWDQLLDAAAELQGLVPGAVLVGGTAAAVHLRHRYSRDADHVLADLAERFPELLEFLERHKEWRTARIRPPKLILGNFQGVETGLRQLVRQRPLETEQVRLGRKELTIPTKAEMLRIKAWLIVIRNAARDYIDFAALARDMGPARVKLALGDFDAYYADAYRGEDASPLVQLLRQLAEPKPHDLGDLDIARYKGITPPWDSWQTIVDQCLETASELGQSLGPRSRN
jgi:hypothetical protein